MLRCGTPKVILNEICCLVRPSVLAYLPASSSGDISSRIEGAGRSHHHVPVHAEPASVSAMLPKTDARILMDALDSDLPRSCRALTCFCFESGALCEETRISSAS